VVEIGCAHGVCTAILAKRAKHVVAIDLSVQALRIAEERCTQKADNITFVHANQGLKYRRALRSLLPSGEAAASNLDWDTACLFVDIGGEGLLHHCEELLRFCLQDLRPRMICIKSRALWNSSSVADNVGHASDTSNVGRAAAGPAPPPSQVSTFDNCRYRESERVRNALPTKPAYALDYRPKRSPVANAAVGDPHVVFVCRFHNFYPRGCTRANCVFCHEVCFGCLRRGHRAVESEACMALASQSLSSKA